MIKNKKWGVNPIVRVNGTSSLRSRNVLSPYIERHVVLNRLEKQLMRQGKSSLAEKIMKDLISQMCLLVQNFDESEHATTEEEIHQRIVEAIHGMGPVVERVSVKRGGASYQVPTPVNPERRDLIGIRWIIEGAKIRVKKEKVLGIADALALEILHVLSDLDNLKLMDEASDLKDYSSVPLTSYGVAKMVALSKAAKSNRVFSHLRWR